jgi:hypothetical protein
MLIMNTSSSNPFTGLKGALAGLMSGGWMGLLLGLLFRRRIAPMLTALEKLFAQFQAGTLPLPVAPARPAAHTPAARTLAARTPAARARVAAPRARHPVPASRRRQVILPAAAPVRAAAWLPWAVPRLRAAPARAPHPPPRYARSSKNAAAKPHSRTPILFRYRN